VSGLVEVRPPSASGETGLVLRGAIAIVLAGLFVIREHQTDQPRNELPLLPYQRRFADLPSPLQLSDRELREGYDEAARVRARTGKWPDPEVLAADGIPPFAGDGVAGAVRDWARVELGGAQLYFGFPREGVARPALLLELIESAPGDPESRDPNTRTDEEHQRLPDGTLVHVTTWFRDATSPASSPAGGGFRPELSGWIQMVSRAGGLAPRAPPAAAAPAGR
jgi:hypothetical protein